MPDPDGKIPRHAGQRPLCMAPFNALLIDPDKGVRPCCRYFPPVGHHIADSVSIGRLDASTSLTAIREGAAWREVADQLAAHEEPIGCRDCLQRERSTGFSGRGDYDGATPEHGLTYLEINTSNLCTLQCRHCDGHFSHRWARVQGLPTHKADTETLRASLRSVDLSRLEVVAFKGGEPLINPDVAATLEHLAGIGRLRHVDVRITTNGTIDPTPFLPLLRQARRVWFNLSVDGVGAVQTYIRHGKSDVENVRRLVSICSSIPGVRFGLICSVMAYNVFQLPEIAAWWRALAAPDNGGRWRRKLRRWLGKPEFLPLSFFNLVTSPEPIAISALQDQTRHALADRYERLDPALYANVVRVLRMPFAGARVHDQFVVETLRNDRLLGRSWRDAIPELAAEMRLLDPESARAQLERAGGVDPASAEALAAALAMAAAR